MQVANDLSLNLNYKAYSEVSIPMLFGATTSYHGSSIMQGGVSLCIIYPM